MNGPDGCKATQVCVYINFVPRLKGTKVSLKCVFDMYIGA